MPHSHDNCHVALPCVRLGMCPTDIKQEEPSSTDDALLGGVGNDSSASEQPSKRARIGTGDHIEAEDADGVDAGACGPTANAVQDDSCLPGGGWSDLLGKVGRKALCAA